MLGSQRTQAARTVRAYSRWVATAKPGDYVIALSGASASVPLIGRHLGVLGGFAALGVGGRRYVSSIVAGMAQARLNPGSAEQRAAQRALAHELTAGVHALAIHAAAPGEGEAKA